MIKNLHKGIREIFTLKQSFSTHISELTTNRFRTMTSLRDVDINYDIGIDFGGDNNEEK